MRAWCQPKWGGGGKRSFTARGRGTDDAETEDGSAIPFKGAVTVINGQDGSAALRDTDSRVYLHWSGG